MHFPTLIALDMDGTLLDGKGQLPPGFSHIVQEATRHGVVLAPASGRQLATLQNMFPEMNTFLAENGTVVMHDGDIVSTTTIDPETVRKVLGASTHIDQKHMTILCTPHMAYVEGETTPEMQAELDKYYKANTHVPALGDINEPVIKIAIYCAAGTEEHVAPVLRSIVDPNTVAISGKVWVDCMAPGANKGCGLKALATAMGISTEDTWAFGDYLNDYELLRAVGYAIAMENAHPDLKKIADRIAPPNTEYGVIQVLDELFTSKH